jgi:DNA-binding PadR family transcriptional regulator
MIYKNFGERRMKENKAKYIILGLLNHEPMSGYDIKKRIEVAIHHFWDLGYGQIYPTLKQCENEGLVTKEVISQSSAPDRKVYSITTQGQAVLHTWIAQPVLKENFKLEILVKLFFSGQLDKQVAIDHVKQFQHRNQIKYAQFTGVATQLAGILEKSPDHLHYYLTVLLGKKMSQAFTEWSEEAIEQLS